MDKTCRICLGGEGEDESLGRLFRPCLCKGSQQFIHEGCLAKWRECTAVPSQRLKCPICRYQYQYSRALLAGVLSSRACTALISGVLIVATVFVVAYSLRFLGVLFLGVRLARGAFSLTAKVMWWSLLIIGWCTLLVMLFSSEGNNGNINFNFGNLFDVADIVPNDWRWGGDGLLAWAGHASGLLGFLAFCKLVWHRVFAATQDYLRAVGCTVLEVQ